MSSNLASGFDRLAPGYDVLASVIIGKGIQHSQLHFLNRLTSCNKLLILGGGTGWILPSILKVNPTLRIDYIDVSPKMIAFSKGRVAQNSQIRFIISTEEGIPDFDYDCVITNFYLDLFNDEKLRRILARIKMSLQPGACWIVTDFVNEKAWHTWTLRLMYGFFQFTTGLKTQKLPSWEPALQSAGGTQLVTEKFSRGFIKSIVCTF